jgi:hypothetical protein
MNKNIVRSAVTALALGATLATSMGAPAMAADGKTTTRNILLGAAAAAGIFTAVNVERKRQLATTVQGYLPDGSTVYRDGRVVSPNGYSWYPGNQGESVACSNQYCTINGQNGYGYGYNGNNDYGYNRYDNGSGSRRRHRGHRP